MRLIGILVGSLALFTPAAFAQAATVAIFASTATDPNVSAPLSSAVYTPVCSQPAFTETLPIINPADGFYADPASALSDCRIALTAQIAALPNGTGYRGAVKIGNGLFGPFSSAFAVAAAQVAHPCDSTPSSPASVNVGQGFTLGWCHSGANVTAWRIYRNGVLVSGVTVTPGATVNAAGDRYFTVSRSEAAVAASVIYEIAGVNGTTEAAHLIMSALAVVQPPPPAPAPATRGRVTVP